MTLSQVKLTIAQGGERRIMSDGNERPTILFGKPEEEFDDSGSGCRIKVACRFIGKEDAGIVDQRTGDRHALLLPAAELRRKMVQASG